MCVRTYYVCFVCGIENRSSFNACNDKDCREEREEYEDDTVRCSDCLKKFYHDSDEADSSDSDSDVEY